MIVPSSNVTMETEVPELMRRHAGLSRRGTERDFTFHSSRAVLHNVDTEALRAMVGESDRCARELADARVDVLAYACLIAIMAEGPGAHDASEAMLAKTVAETGYEIPVTSSAGALVRCLQRLGATRVAVVAPYMRPLTRVVCDYLAAYDIEVVSSISLEVPDNVEVGRLDPSHLLGHARGLDMTGVEAVILSACVQMPSLPVLAAAGDELGLPVLSAATATAAEILSLLGEEPFVPGAGAALCGDGVASRQSPFG
ncbi:MAG: maleate cis-trans isomerase family protein [Acidimicrobiales bacterium]